MSCSLNQCLRFTHREVQVSNSTSKKPTVNQANEVTAERNLEDLVILRFSSNQVHQTSKVSHDKLAQISDTQALEFTNLHQTQDLTSS